MRGGWEIMGDNMGKGDRMGGRVTRGGRGRRRYRHGRGSWTQEVVPGDRETKPYIKVCVSKPEQHDHLLPPVY